MPPTVGSVSFSTRLKPPQTPGVGHRREDLTTHPVLFFPVGAYLIIYQVERQPIGIVAVTQGSRDIPAFLHRRLRP
jgi:plasmid stabilization system protein ParE